MLQTRSRHAQTVDFRGFDCSGAMTGSCHGRHVRSSKTNKAGSQGLYRSRRCHEQGRSWISLQVYLVYRSCWCALGAILSICCFDLCYSLLLLRRLSQPPFASLTSCTRSETVFSKRSEEEESIANRSFRSGSALNNGTWNMLIPISWRCKYRKNLSVVMVLMIDQCLIQVGELWQALDSR